MRPESRGQTAHNNNILTRCRVCLFKQFSFRHGKNSKLTQPLGKDFEDNLRITIGTSGDRPVSVGQHCSLPAAAFPPLESESLRPLRAPHSASVLLPGPLAEDRTRTQLKVDILTDRFGFCVALLLTVTRTSIVFRVAESCTC